MVSSYICPTQTKKSSVHIITIKIFSFLIFRNLVNTILIKAYTYH